MASAVKEWLVQFVSSPEFLGRYPLYASILTKLDPISDPSVSVIAVSACGERFYLHVNVGFFMSNPGFLVGLLLHEVHHIVLGHLSNPRFHHAVHGDLMELAMEISANEYISEPLPGCPLTWEKFQGLGVRAGQSTAERYKLLVAGRNAGEETGNAGDGLVDDHLPGAVGRRPLWRLGPPPDEFTDVPDLAARLIENAVRRTRQQEDAPVPPALQARQSLLAGRHPGQLIEALRGAENEPEHFMDWRAALQMFVARVRAPVHTYSRPNRRFRHLVGVVPGRAYCPREGEKPSLIVAIDTSGSMALRELGEIARQLVPLSSWASVTIVECDAAIQRVYPFAGSVREVAGRGGTDLRPVFDRAFLAEHRPDGVVYFTDGCGPYPRQDPGVRTLWVLTKPAEFECPWGERARGRKGATSLPPRRSQPRRASRRGG